MQTNQVLLLAICLGFFVGKASSQSLPDPPQSRTPSPWVWVGKSYHSDRYINVSSIHRDGAYIKYFIAFTTASREDPSMRQVVSDCEAKTRVELDEYETFSSTKLKSYYPGTVIGAEAQFACDEAARKFSK